MIYRTISLYDLQRQNIGKDVIKNILSDFYCPLNSDVEDFVHKKAYDFERVGFMLFKKLEDNMLIYLQPTNNILKAVIKE